MEHPVPHPELFSVGPGHTTVGIKERPDSWKAEWNILLIVTQF